MYRKKVTFIFGITHPVSNGVGNCTLSYAAALAQAGYETSVLTCLLSPEDPACEVYHGVKFFRILRYRILGSRILGIIHMATVGYLRILLHLRYTKPDIIVGMMLDYGTISAFMGSLLGIKSITNAQGSDVDEVVTTFRKLETLYALKKNNIVTTTNTEFKEKLLLRWKRKIILWPNILDENLIPETKSVSLNYGFFNIVAVGRLVRINGIETKGIGHIIKAMQGLERCNLYIFGDGPLASEYKELIKELNLEDNIILCGHQSREIMLNYFKSANVLVFPSLTEGLSMTVIEAMYSGLPVISTKVGGQADHIKDGINGFFVEKASSQSIKDKIKYLMANPDVLKTVSRNAKSYYNEHFSFKAFTKSFEKTISTFS
ncbi:glycosyl transferase, group 1 [Candidatus Scalindua japonica]|uniref:Glycosyl transferase, group 1 n=1 Tax=Candidatus Scalindua japonica TaxID=1284222 RepID=A0A286TX00_9BACT|nr:glycosyltransferase family 4 protein [Candidatus Scalindua japonica]GAX60361.1 glycosyl transferase, group 1 [Candidatus Scalindua japonica]